MRRSVSVGLMFATLAVSAEGAHAQRPSMKVKTRNDIVWTACAAMFGPPGALKRYITAWEPMAESQQSAQAGDPGYFQDMIQRKYGANQRLSGNPQCVSFDHLGDASRKAIIAAGHPDPYPSFNPGPKSLEEAIAYFDNRCGYCRVPTVRTGIRFFNQSVTPVPREYVTFDRAGSTAAGSGAATPASGGSSAGGPAASTAAANAAAEAKADAIVAGVVVGAAVVGGIIGDIQRNREDKERIRAADAAAKQKYRERVEATWASMPRQPECGPNSPVIDITVGQTTTGNITGGECRRYNHSVVRYRLHVPRKQTVDLKVEAFQFYPTVVLHGGGYSTPEGYKLDAGTYDVEVSTEFRGETGQYTLRVPRGRLSTVSGRHIGLYVANNRTQAPDLGVSMAPTVVGIRLGYGFADRILLSVSGAGGPIALAFKDVAGRVYLSNNKSKYRAYATLINGSYGYMHGDVFSSSGGVIFDARGTSWGLGVEQFAGGRNLAFDYTLTFGPSSTVDDDNSVPPTSMSRTMLGFGLSFHW